MRADTELFKDKIEVSLDGRQVFYLFFGGAVIASLVFVLGVMVGKRVEARTALGSVALASNADDPLTALDRLSQGQGQTRSFRSALMDGDDDPRYAVDIALADKAKNEAGKESASAAKVVKVEAAKVEANKVEAAKAEVNKAEAAKQEAAKQEAAKQEAAKQEAARQEAAKQEAAKQEAAKQEAAKQEAAKQAAAKQAAVAERDEAGSDDADQDDAHADDGPPRFTLQLSSFQDRVEADSFFDKLESAGYQPYIVEAEVPDKGTWYRVRLGARLRTRSPRPG